MRSLHIHVPSLFFHGTARPVRALSGILLGFSLSVAVLFLTVFICAGRPTLLASAATIKPYSVAYRSSAVYTPGGEDRLHPNNPIIFLGDSSVAQAPWAPPGLPGIPDLLQEALQESHRRPSSIEVIDWSFAGGRLFHYYCLLFEAEKHAPSLVVIPINWRSLGPLEDDWNETFAFPELSSLIPAEERPFSACAALMQREGISKSQQALYAFHRPMLYISGMKSLIRSEFSPEPAPPPQIKILQSLAPGEHFIERYADKRLFEQYATVIAEDTPSVNALRLIVETAGRRDIRVCFYITPFHIEEMRSRRSFDLSALNASLERIVAAATSETTVCLDLSGLLQEDYFLDVYEHYTLEGSRSIALALAPAVQELMAR